MAEVTTMNAASPSLDNVAMPSTGDCSILRVIPKELLEIIVSFGDVTSNVRLAATSAWFRDFVFSKCPCGWADIDFGKIPTSQAEKLSDADLFTLLTNVKAVQVTSSLSLMGCTSVEGRGLAALMYSRCLEIIELRRSRNEMETYGETGLDDTFVLGVLSSMAPINTQLPHSRNGGLKLVKIRKQLDEVNFYDSFYFSIRHFFSNLNDAIARQVKERRVPCKICECALVDTIYKDDFSWRAPASYCSKCKSYKCCGSTQKYYSYEGVQDC